MVGDGIVTFGVWPLVPDELIFDFRYSKSAFWMSLTWRTLSTTRITGGESSSLPSGFLTRKGGAVLTPPSCSRKSMWK